VHQLDGRRRAVGGGWIIFSTRSRDGQTQTGAYPRPTRKDGVTHGGGQQRRTSGAIRMIQAG
jgi:hypothetical protein